MDVPTRATCQHFDLVTSTGISTLNAHAHQGHLYTSMSHKMSGWLVSDIANSNGGGGVKMNRFAIRE